MLTVYRASERSGDVRVYKPSGIGWLVRVTVVRQVRRVGRFAVGARLGLAAPNVLGDVGRESAEAAQRIESDVESAM